MTESEWLECTKPDDMLEVVRPGSTERKLRLFDVACCRRIWHLLTDERCRMAVETAERYADGAVTSDQLALDRGPAHEAFFEAAMAEYEGEFANGVFDPVRYEPLCTRLSMAAAVRAVVSAKAGQLIDLLDAYHPSEADWDHRRGRGCHRFTAFAAGGAERVRLDTVHASASLTGTDRWAISEAGNEAEHAEAREQAALLREIFGNPFRPVTVDQSWLLWNDGLIPRLARAVYEERLLPPGTLDPVRLAILADALEEAGCDNAEVLNHCRQGGEHVRGCWVVDSVLAKC
jgi:hypothetical protein